MKDEGTLILLLFLMFFQGCASCKRLGDISDSLDRIEKKLEDIK